VCVRCGHVLYLNPKVAAGTLPVRDGRVALIRRGVEPGLDLWSWPCGYVEIDEEVEQAAVRETLEETGLRVGLGDLLGLYSYPVEPGTEQTLTTGLIIAAWETTSVEGELAAGHDAADADWFALDDVPWDRLAFDSSHRALRDLLARR
jgi:ADP-ribose pyrophosphatase YjhB (NUDIX family)